MADDLRPVKKAVELIHIGNSLSLVERRTFNALLWNAYPKLLKEEKHKLTGPQLKKLLGYKATDQKPLKAALTKLMTTYVELVDEPKTWTASTFLASASLKRGYCEYSFSPHLKDVLWHPRLFSRFFLEIQRRFSGAAALCLYENCKRYQVVKSTGWKTVDDWRKLLGVDGHPHYFDFKQFNSKVIKVAVKEVNQTSDIHVTPDLRRAGRKVVSIRFKIKPNPQPTLFEDLHEEEDDFDDMYKEIVSNMNNDEFNEMHERFRQEIVNPSPFLRQRYETGGFESRPVQVTFQEYVIKQKQTLPQKA